VISPRLVLTCWHVVVDAAIVEVATASAGSRRFSVIDKDKERDVALLEPEDPDERLDEELIVIPRALWSGARPTGDRALVELSITEAELPSSVGVALRPAPRSAGHVEFVVPAAREDVEHGFSGAPVVVLQSGSDTPRLLGIVRARDPERVDVLDRSGTGWLVPTERIAERLGKVAELVETPVESSSTWRQHWEPRSRGVVSANDRGFYYAGHRRAYERLRAHLQSQTPGLLVVVAERARGKSALLARTVVLACPRYLALLADQAQAAIGGYRCLSAPVDAVVLARAKSPDTVAGEIVEQLGLGSRIPGEPSTPEELVSAIGAVSSTVVIDAVDESNAPREVVLLAKSLADAGARVAVGLHRRLASAIPAQAVWLDLDGEYRDDSAIREYVAARLSRGGPYDEHTASTVARAVAERAKGNFLMAELAGRTLAGEVTPIDTREPDWRRGLPTDLTEAFSDYLERFGDQRERMLALLHPLAHALGDGFTIEPGTAWLATANRLRSDLLPELTREDLRDVAIRAEDYLVSEIQTDTGQTTRRLWHEGIGDAIRTVVAQDALAHARGDPHDQQAIQRIEASASEKFTAALEGLLPRERDAPAEAYLKLDRYLLGHIPDHLADQGQGAELLARSGLLLTADQDALRRALVHVAFATLPEDEPARIAAVYALATRHADPIQRATALCAALLRQGAAGLAARVRAAVHADRLPRELISGPPLPPSVATIPDAHTDSIQALAVVDGDDGPLIISAGFDGALRSWRPDGQPGPVAVPDAHTDRIRALALVDGDQGPLIVSAGFDRALRSWRLDGQPGPLAVPDAHTGPILALAVVDGDQGPLIVSAGFDRALRTWRLDGQSGPLVVPDAHTDPILALAVVEGDQGPLIVSAGADRALRSWRLDGQPGPFAVTDAHTNPIEALAVVKGDQGPLIVSAGVDRALRSWRLDGQPGPLVVPDAHTDWIRALSVVEGDQGPLIVSAGFDGALGSWRLDGLPGPLAVPDAHTARIRALAVLGGDQGPLIISAGEDRALRSWRLDRQPGPLAVPEAHTRRILALAVVEGDQGPVIVSAGDDPALRSWRLDGQPGPLAVPGAHTGRILALAVVDGDQGPLIVSAGFDGALRSWRLDGQPGPLAVPEAHTGPILALAVVDGDEGPLIISAGVDGALRSWRLDGQPGPLAVPDAHTGWIQALALVDGDEGPLIVSAGEDLALLSWRPDGQPGPLAVPDAHTGPILALAVVDGDEGPLIISAGDDLALLSWRLDGQPGPLAVPDAHTDRIRALAVVKGDQGPVIVSADFDGALGSWRLDGQPGPLAVPDAHTSTIRALALLDGDEGPLIISAGEDRTIFATSLRWPSLQDTRVNGVKSRDHGMHRE
jgi:WD40 repeat protein